MIAIDRCSRHATLSNRVCFAYVPHDGLEHSYCYTCKAGSRSRNIAAIKLTGGNGRRSITAPLANKPVKVAVPLSHTRASLEPYSTVDSAETVWFCSKKICRRTLLSLECRCRTNKTCQALPQAVAIRLFLKKIKIQRLINLAHIGIHLVILGDVTSCVLLEVIKESQNFHVRQQPQNGVQVQKGDVW